MFRLIAATAGVVVLLGAYIVADATDTVPGVLTTEPRPTVTLATPAPSAIAPTVTAAAPDETPAVDAGKLGAALQPLLADPAVGPGAAVSVLEPGSDKALIDINATVPVPPASTAKLLTAGAALSVLGPDRRLPTTVLRDPAQDGVIVLRGGGDILLASARGDPRKTVGAAGLLDLAEQTVAQLRAGQHITLLLDDQLFPGIGTGAPLPPGWQQQDIDAGYAAPASALAIDAGRTEPERYARRDADPPMVAARVFAGRLRDRGIIVDGIRRARTPAAAQPFAEVMSAPVNDLVAYMLAESDNNMADVLARLVAMAHDDPADARNAARAVLAEATRLGVPTAGLTLADASGLSAGSRLSAQALTATLAASNTYPALATLPSSLPVAGVSGTLAARFEQPAAAAGVGVVRGKSGSLATVSALAGSLRDRDGRVMYYAIVAPSITNGWRARQVLDQMAATMAACGCR